MSIIASENRLIPFPSTPKQERMMSKPPSSKYLLAVQHKKVNPHCECVVCMDAESTICLVPCEHQCLCNICSRLIAKCPLCRAKVLDKTVDVDVTTEVFMKRFLQNVPSAQIIRTKDTWAEELRKNLVHSRSKRPVEQSYVTFLMGAMSICDYAVNDLINFANEGIDESRHIIALTNLEGSNIIQMLSQELLRSVPEYIEGYQEVEEINHFYQIVLFKQTQICLAYDKVLSNSCKFNIKCAQLMSLLDIYQATLITILEMVRKAFDDVSGNSRFLLP